MQKIIRNYFIVGIICILVGTGITGIITGRQLHNLRESEAAVVSSIAELKRQNQELTDIVAKLPTLLWVYYTKLLSDIVLFQ